MCRGQVRLSCHIQEGHIPAIAPYPTSSRQVMLEGLRPAK